MANKTIPQLPAAPAALLTNLFEIDNGGASQKLTLAQIQTLLNPSFASAQMTLNAATYSAAHGLGATPKIVRTVLVCVVNDANTGYSVGDEVDIFSLFDGAQVNAFAVWATVTTIMAACPGDIPIGNEANYSIAPKNGGVPATVSSFNNFRLKFYAIP